MVKQHRERMKKKREKSELVREKERRKVRIVKVVIKNFFFFKIWATVDHYNWQSTVAEMLNILRIADLMWCDFCGMRC